MGSPSVVVPRRAHALVESEEEGEAGLEHGLLDRTALDRAPPARDPPQLTVRSVVVGLLVGTVLCFTNMYFGLQTGWVTMGSIQCAVVGFIFCRALWPRGFGPHENVVVQTIGVAAATMPLAGGFVGIIPALQLLDPPHGPGGIGSSVWRQLAWAAALCYFGIFFAVPLRRQTILVERLRFPSGTATAKLIEVLHGAGGEGGRDELASRWRTLYLAFAASFTTSLLAYFIPAAANLKVFSWLCAPNLSAWHWTLRPTLSYVGQGMIMGARPALSTLGGALTSWAILGPIALASGWVGRAVNLHERAGASSCDAPSVDADMIDSWEDGVQGWVLWVALALMLGEALTALALVLARQCAPLLSRRRAPAKLADGASGAEAAERARDALEVAPASQLVPTSWWAGGLALSSAFAVATLSPLLDMPAWQTGVSLLLSCLIAVLAVRALGQTDLNPVSAVGKLSQIIFALVAPGHLVANVVAGAISEAGAMQVGDLMQDLKTGHLLRASPRAQFVGQLIGSTASVFITVFAYQLYTSIHHIPSDQFPVPVAYVWKDMAVLMKRGISALPPTATRAAVGFGAAGVALPLLEAVLPPAAAALLPSGISFGVGMYLTADWTIPRVIGALVEWRWRARDPASHGRHMLMVASGFVLGEGVMSILGLALTAMHAPRLGG